MSRDDETLEDICNAIDRVAVFISGMGKSEFLEDEKTQSAVLHQLLVIGEAVKRLSEAFRKAKPVVPWKQLAGMRDRLIHGYDDVDLDEVWKTVATELPGIRARLDS